MRSENAAILKLTVILKSVWLRKGGMLAGSGFVRRYLAWLPTACGFTRRHNRPADANRIKLAQPSNLLILRRALSGMSRGAVYLRLLKFK